MSVMQSGTQMVKLKRGTKGLVRLFYLDEHRTRLRWRPSRKSEKAKIVFAVDEGFTNFMRSPACDVFNPLHHEVYQDMDQPLCNYYIASSHNTYLTGDQLLSQSKVDMYARVLQEGCRCVEVILSIENHCSIQQQRKIAQYLKGVFQDKLDLSSVDTGECRQLPSPQSLKGKILVKNLDVKESGKKSHGRSLMTNFGKHKTQINETPGFWENMGAHNGGSLAKEVLIPPCIGNRVLRMES
ncbi:hypothetical protein A6R68_17640, partial [Neotoma lepida]